MAKRDTLKNKDIIAAAVKIIREQGWRQLSARTLARELHCSTMPIYSHLQSMEEIYRTAQMEAMALLQEYCQRHYSDKPDLNRVLGFLLFAREEANLYRFLVSDRPPQLEDGYRMDVWNGPSLGTLYELPLQLLKGHLLFKGMDERLLKSSIFIYGLATAINEGLMRDWDVAEWEQLLDEVQEAFMFWSWQAKKRGQHGSGEKVDRL